MKFEIDFNRSGDKNDTKEFFDFIGAELYERDEYSTYRIEINSIEDLQPLLEKINMHLCGNKFQYSFIMSFDPAVIYLDDKV